MDGVSRIESSSASQSGAFPALLTRTPSKPKAVDELREILSASKQSAAKQSAARRAAAASPKAAAAAVSPLIKFTPPRDAPAADSPHVRSSRGRFNKLLSSKLSSCRKRSRGDPAALGAPSEGLFDFDEAEDADGVANGAKAAKSPPRTETQASERAAADAQMPPVSSEVSAEVSAEASENMDELKDLEFSSFEPPKHAAHDPLDITFSGSTQNSVHAAEQAIKVQNWLRLSLETPAGLPFAAKLQEHAEEEPSQQRAVKPSPRSGAPHSDAAASQRLQSATGGAANGRPPSRSSSRASGVISGIDDSAAARSAEAWLADMAESQPPIQLDATLPSTQQGVRPPPCRSANAPKEPDGSFGGESRFSVHSEPSSVAAAPQQPPVASGSAPPVRRGLSPLDMNSPRPPPSARGKKGDAKAEVASAYISAEAPEAEVAMHELEPPVGSTIEPADTMEEAENEPARADATAAAERPLPRAERKLVPPSESKAVAWWELPEVEASPAPAARKPAAARPIPRSRPKPEPKARAAGETGSASGWGSSASAGRSAAAAARPVALPDKASELLKVYEEHAKLLTGYDVEWEKRCASIQLMPPLLGKLLVAAQPPGAFGKSPFEATLDALVQPIAKQLGDLRSGVVRAASQMLVTVSKEIGAPIAPLVPGVLPQLFKNLYVSIKAISLASNDAALHLVQRAPSEKALQVIVQHTADKHKDARRGSAELIHAMLEQPGFAGALGVQQLNGILKALEALVADADATVRTAAAKTFWGVHTRFPSDADAMLAKLDASRQKAVGRHKP